MLCFQHSCWFLFQSCGVRLLITATVTERRLRADGASEVVDEKTVMDSSLEITQGFCCSLHIWGILQEIYYSKVLLNPASFFFFFLLSLSLKIGCRLWQMTSMTGFSIEGYCEEEKYGGKEFHMPDTPNIKTGRPEQRRKQMPCSDSERCSVWNSSHSCYTVGFCFLWRFCGADLSSVWIGEQGLHC